MNSILELIIGTVGGFVMLAFCLTSAALPLLSLGYQVISGVEGTFKRGLKLSVKCLALSVGIFLVRAVLLTIFLQ